jgi:hypothetical protein
MATNGTYLNLLDDSVRQHVYKMLFNEVLRELVPTLIGHRKTQILRAIWSDPYLHAILSEGVIEDIMVDKDTHDFDDQQYFFIVNTNLPRTSGRIDYRVITIFEQLVHIVARCGSRGQIPFKINMGADIDADPGRATHSFAVPLSC